jgi:hypothetical protein
MVAITARISGRDLGSTVRDVQRVLDKPGFLPKNVPYTLGGLYEQQQTKGSPLTLKERLHGKLLEVHVAEVKDGMQILRGLPDVYGVALGSGLLRIQARDPEALLDGWLKRWHYENLRWLGYSWVEPDMEDVFVAHSQRYFAEKVHENLSCRG